MQTGTWMGWTDRQTSTQRQIDKMTDSWVYEILNTHIDKHSVRQLSKKIDR